MDGDYWARRIPFVYNFRGARVQVNQDLNFYLRNSQKRLITKLHNAFVTQFDAVLSAYPEVLPTFAVAYSRAAIKHFEHRLRSEPQAKFQPALHHLECRQFPHVAMDELVQDPSLVRAPSTRAYEYYGFHALPEVYASLPMPYAVFAGYGLSETDASVPLQLQRIGRNFAAKVGIGVPGKSTPTYAASFYPLRRSVPVMLLFSDLRGFETTADVFSTDPRDLAMLLLSNPPFLTEGYQLERNISVVGVDATATMPVKKLQPPSEQQWTTLSVSFKGHIVREILRPHSALLFRCHNWMAFEWPSPLFNWQIWVAAICSLGPRPVTPVEFVLRNTAYFGSAVSAVRWGVRDNHASPAVPQIVLACLCDILDACTDVHVRCAVRFFTQNVQESVREAAIRDLCRSANRMLSRLSAPPDFMIPGMSMPNIDNTPPAPFTMEARERLLQFASDRSNAMSNLDELDAAGTLLFGCTG